MAMTYEQTILNESFDTLAEMARVRFSNLAAVGDEVFEKRDAVVFGFAKNCRYEYIASKDQRLGMRRDTFTREVKIVCGNTSDLVALTKNARALMEYIVGKEE